MTRDIEVDGEGTVEVVSVTEPTGWAIFTGCDGEDPTFHAFFADLDDAERYVSMCADPDSDSYMCDPDIAPAIVNNRTILVGNHFDRAVGAEAVIKASGLTDFDVVGLRAEARRR